MNSAIRSIAGVCRVELLRGVDADPTAVPDLLLEVPHGATRAHHFADLRARLAGPIAAELVDFFFVNTDVGAPELARAIAAQVVAASPDRSAMVLCSDLPRTLIDCNRRLDAASSPRSSAPGQMTPGLPPWIREVADQRLLLQLHGEYRGVAAAAFAAVCGSGGLGMMVHTYAPRSLDVPVDERIVEHLRAAYEPDRIGSWPLRAEIDLITHDPDGRELANPELVRHVSAGLGAAGRQVVHNGVYSLHPSTLAYEFAESYPRRTLCFEVRRDLLVGEFVPFRELEVDLARTAALAAPFAGAVVAALG